MLTVNQKMTLVPASLTASFYKLARNAMERGYMGYLLSLFQLAEEDAYISGCLIARRAGFKRSYTITPATDSPADQRAAELITLTLGELPVWEIFECIVNARMYGYSVLGLNWEIQNGLQVPTSVKSYPQKYFCRDPKDKRLKLDYGTTLKNIPENSAAVFEFDGVPILMKILKEYILKEGGVQSWANFIEVFGNPFVFGFYPPGSSDKIKTELETGIKSVGQSTTGIAPSGTDIKILESQKNTGDHSDFELARKKNISMALLGHEEAAGSSKTMSIGENKNGLEVKKEIAIDDMVYIEAAMRQIIQMVIDRNIVVTRYPKISIDKSDVIDTKTKLEALRIALDGGAEVDAKFMAQFGIPIVNPDQPLKITNPLNLGV